MKVIYFIILSVLTTSLFSITILGSDSGQKSITMYENGVKSDKAILIIGGIHGDEAETIQVVSYLNEKLDSNVSTYLIPSINPTLYSIQEKSNEGIIIINGRRGYLSEHLTNEGFVKSNSRLQDFDKKLFYRIFYGSNKTYMNGISHYVDPNRDFLERRLPSTRLLIELIETLKKQHSEIIILSFHGYMSGGRIYPEYSLKDGNIVINEKAWILAEIFESSSGFTKERMYPPAIPIIERFEGELIRFTGSIKNVTGLDIELDKNNKTDNFSKSLLGVMAIIDYLNKQ